MCVCKGFSEGVAVVKKKKDEVGAGGLGKRDRKVRLSHNS